ncbi:hypothetical protein [Methylotuvimicrobium buryatense]|nr:hypothetical protein [Methylotuvimicrobium buryatense]
MTYHERIIGNGFYPILAGIREKYAIIGRAAGKVHAQREKGQF